MSISINIYNSYTYLCSYICQIAIKHLDCFENCSYLIYKSIIINTRQRRFYIIDRIHDTIQALPIFFCTFIKELTDSQLQITFFRIRKFSLAKRTYMKFRICQYGIYLIYILTVFSFSYTNNDFISLCKSRLFDMYIKQV